MTSVLEEHVTGCDVCRLADAPPDITMVFQPIVDLSRGVVWAQEALVRGVDGQSAGEVLSQVTDHNRFRFDQACRVVAIRQAAEAGLPPGQLLSINFLPNAIYDPATCIRTAVAAARAHDVALSSLMFELTEVEKVEDVGRMKSIVEDYRQRGFRTAIDDFGAGYSGLNLLVDFLPDVVKLDMHLIRDIHVDPARQKVVEHTSNLCRDLRIDVVAEGVEVLEEAMVLWDLGISLHQGYLYARPDATLGPVPDQIVSSVVRRGRF